VLTMTLKRLDGTTILGCHGKLVRDEETPLLCLAVGLHGQDVVLDLSHTTAIDGSGIGALISLQAAGVFLALRNPNEQVMRSLQLNHLESIFEISESAATAALV
jgi:anti-anti-sigma regulatory factor